MIYLLLFIALELALILRAQRTSCRNQVQLAKLLGMLVNKK